MAKVNPQWFNDDDNEFREILESNIATSQQEEATRRVLLAELQHDMQIAYGQFQRVLAQPQKLPEKIHNNKGGKRVYPNRITKTQSRKTQEPTPQSHPFYPWIQLHQPRSPVVEPIPEKELQKLDMSWFPWDSIENIEMNLIILGNNLSVQLATGLLSKETIQPDGLKG